MNKVIDPSKCPICSEPNQCAQEIAEVTESRLRGAQAGKFTHGVWLTPLNRPLLKAHASRGEMTVPTPFK